MALRPSYSTAENVREEKKLLYPKGSRQEINSLISEHGRSSSPSHLFAALQPGRFAGVEPHTPRGLEVVHVGWEQRWHLYRINHSYQRERDSALWTETWYYFIQKWNYKYIYMIMIDYIYVQLHIDIYTASKYIVKRIPSADLPTLDTQQRACCPRVCIKGNTVVSTVLP